MSNILRKIIICLLISVCSQAYPQDDEGSTTNQLWADFYAYYYFKPNWEFYGDIGYRTIPEDFSWQVYNIRPSIRYIALSIWEAHGGIGIFQTFNKDDLNSFEIRPWQGAKIKWPSFDPVYFSHYFRIEERFFIPQGSALEFNFRFRYQLGLKIYAYRFKNKSHIFIPAFGEVFVDFGPQISESFSNRNRLGAGIGYKTHNEWTFELRYVGQHSRAGAEHEFNTSERFIQIRVRKHLFKKEYRAAIPSDEID